jgi:hypothetical protein
MIIFILSFFLHTQVFAQEVLEGKDSSGKPCSLIIEKWEIKGDAGDWRNLDAVVRTSWQKAEKASFKVSPTWSPYTLYGNNKADYEKIAIEFHTTPVPEIAKIKNYMFQSWSEEGGLLQTYCRFYL